MIQGCNTLQVGPTNPKYIGAFSDCSYFVEYETDCKYCFGTNQYVHCNHRRCLTEIRPQQVIDMVYQALEKANYKNV